MAEDEKDIVAGIEILAKIKADLSSVLGGIADVEKRGLHLKVTADQSAVSGIGASLNKVVEEAGSKLKFAFQAIGKASDLENGLTGVQSQLDQLVKGAKEFNMTMGGQTFSIKGAQDLAEFRKNFSQYADAVTPAGKDVKLGISGITENNTENLKAAKAVREFSDNTKKANTYWDRFVEHLGQGRPQRAISELATGALTPALGEVGAGIAGGATGMIVGGAVFRLGWQAMQALEQIPDRISENIEHYRHYDTMRASAALPPADMPIASDAAKATVKSTEAWQDHLQNANDFWRRMGKDSDEGAALAGRYEGIVASLSMEIPQDQLKDPAKHKAAIDRINDIAMQSMLAEQEHPLASNKAETIAWARFRMLKDRGGKAREELMSSEMAMDALIASNVTTRGKAFAMLPRESQEAIVHEQLAQPATIPGTNIPNPAAWTPEKIEKAIRASMPTEQIEAVIKQHMGETRYGAWRHENPWFGDWLKDAGQRSQSDRLFLKDAKALITEGTEATDQIATGGGGIFPGTEAWRASGRLSEYRRKRMESHQPLLPGKDEKIDGVPTEDKLMDWLETIAGVKHGRGKELFPHGLGAIGNIADLFNLGGVMPSAPGMGQPTVSISSPSELANKMQSQNLMPLDFRAGAFNDRPVDKIDPADKTAENTTRSAATLERIELLLSNQQPAHMFMPTDGSDPAWDNANIA